jgi:hypothetical protein
MSYVSDPGKFAVAVVPSDVTVLTPTRKLWIGAIGNLTVRMYGDGQVVTFSNLPVGWADLQVTQVMAATTAGSIVAVW